MPSDSKNSESPTIERVFGLLDRWRHLPAYKLEPRADIFFALYLPEVLGKHFGIKINPLLVPEFPIKKKGDNTSNKADYLALQESEDGKPAKRAFLVELKTDMASRREEQDEYLDYAVGEGLHWLIEDILEICRTTEEKAKYVHLLWRLSELGLVEGVSEGIVQLYESASLVAECHPNRQGEASKRGKKFAEARRGVKPAEISWPELKLVYIQPRKYSEDGGWYVIDFKEFAEMIEYRAKEKGESDGIGRMFANYLRKWADEDAGSPNPKD